MINFDHNAVNFDNGIDPVNLIGRINQPSFVIFYDFSINYEKVMSPLFSIFELYSTIKFSPLKNTTIC